MSRRSAAPTIPIWSPAASHELDYELEVAAVVDTPALDLPPERAEEAIGGYTIFNDWSARDLQREETAVRLGPAKGKDFASSFGPWLVTPDELADARSGTGYDLAMTAEVNGTETSRGRWSDAQFSFGEMLARASADVHLRPGDLVGSGTVGTGCLLEVRDATLGRYLEPGDEVVLRVERLGALRNPIVARAAVTADALDPRTGSSPIEPMTAADWPEVRRIYAEGIATGDATLEREAPDWGHFDRSHPAECRLVARVDSAGGVLGWTALGGYSARGVQRRRVGERLRGGAAPEVGASAAPSSRRSSRPPRPPATGRSSPGVLAENDASLALHERVGFRRVGVQRRLGQDARGRWRDVVLLERRSEVVG